MLLLLLILSRYGINIVISIIKNTIYIYYFYYYNCYLYIIISTTICSITIYSMNNLIIFGCVRGHPFMTSTRRGEGVRLRWTGGGGGSAPCGRPHRNLKLESTDLILSSSHAKKLASFLPEFHLWTEKKWKFFCDIN